MADVGDTFKPGEKTPDSGLYTCDSGCSHQWSTDVAGHTLPPLPGGCSGAEWKLAEKRP